MTIIGMSIISSFSYELKNMLMKYDQRVKINGDIEPNHHRMVIQLPDPKLLWRTILYIALILSFFFWLIMLHNVAKDNLLSHDVDILYGKYELKLECTLASSALNLAIKNEALTGGVGRRRLLSVIPVPKKEALNRLEGAVLEPPKNNKYRRRTRYLPDLMGDTLAGYPRRVFVDIGAAGRDRSDGWFKRNYPKRDLDFEIIRVDFEVEGSNEKEDEMMEWLKRNIKEEEYVVMKAEAEVVLEMVKGKAIGLVDELFLECRNQWHMEKKNKKKGGVEAMKSSRAYWECLSLYGRLKDEGIAVHQWWD